MAAEDDDRKEFDWDLPIYVPTIGVHRTLRVTSNESIGAVMIKLATKLGDADWSDFALWWPDKAIWLNKPRQSLYAYGIMSDAKLEFVPVHRYITVELPDHHRYQMRVNCAIMTFFTVAEICRELKIRHPEEISLLRNPSDKEGFAKLTGWTKKRKGSHTGQKSRESTPNRYGDGDNLSVDSGDILGNTPPGSPATQRKRKYPALALSAVQRAQQEQVSGSSLPVDVIHSHLGEAPDGGFFSEKLQRTSVEKCYINGLWLDSSKTLYEQDIKEHDLLYLRYKYFSIMEIDARLDESRIAELYEQAKWSILTEEVDCTEEEAYTFAALQFQVKQAVSQEKAQTHSVSAAPIAQTAVDDTVTDIDAALTSLQQQLGQVETSSPRATGAGLQLTGYIKFIRGTRTTFKSPKKFFFKLKGTTLSYYKSEEEQGEPAIQKFNLTGAEALPDLDVAKKKFSINIILPSSDETGEFRLTFENSEEYSSWLAGCKMVMKGRSLARTGYDQELASIRSFVAMQNRADPSGGPADQDELKPEDVVSPRILKKKKAKDVARQILEAHASMLNLTSNDAKLQYIRNWQALQGFGITYFLVKVGRSRKEELLGIAYNRLILIDLGSGEHKKMWRYSAMKSWNVNWESKQLRIDHEEEKLLFQCLSADLKIVHEFIGGNIWLSLRNDKDPLDIAMFVKLTGGVTNNLSGWGSETMTRFLAT